MTWIGVLDVARWALFVGGMLLAGGLAIVAIDKGNVRGRRWAAFGASVSMIVLAGSRLQHLGEPVTWQFAGAIVAFGAFTAAFVTYRRDGNGRLDQ